MWFVDQLAKIVVLYLEPILKKEKGLVNLGRILAWVCVVEFPHANQIAALTQSFDLPTTGMQQGHKFELLAYNLADKSNLGFV